MVLKNTLAALGAVVLLLGSGVAIHAAVTDDYNFDGMPDDPPQRHVSTAGLDLTRPEDQAMLRRRVSWAAASVCGQDDGGALGGTIGFERCRDDAIASAEGGVRRAISHAYAGRERLARAAFEPVAPAPAPRFIPAAPPPVSAMPRLVPAGYRRVIHVVKTTTTTTTTIRTPMLVPTARPPVLVRTVRSFRAPVPVYRPRQVRIFRAPMPVYRPMPVHRAMPLWVPTRAPRINCSRWAIRTQWRADYCTPPRYDRR